MNKLRRFIDRILLSDHEWKKKYCPELYHYLFEATAEERTAIFEKLCNCINEERIIKEKEEIWLQTNLQRSVS